jgi:hypothetical protein
VTYNIPVPKHSEGLASEPLIAALLDEDDTSVGIAIFADKPKKVRLSEEAPVEAEKERVEKDQAPSGPFPAS